MDANAIKAAIGGLVALGAVALVTTMFINFGRGYEQMPAPVAQPAVPAPSIEDCIQHNYDRREETKRRIREVEDKQRRLSRGETATQNDAHRAYLEKSYKNELDRLEKIYDGLQRERCEE